MNPLCQFSLVVELDCLPLGLELLITCVALELSQFRHVQHPLISLEVLSVQLGEQGIRSHDPSSGCDSIGHVDELVWEELVKILEESLLEQLGVKEGDSVDLVRSDHTQVGHSDLFRD